MPGKLSIVVGHNSVAPGANTYYMGHTISENAFYKIEVVPEIERLFDEINHAHISDIKFFYRHFQGKRRYKREMREVYGRVNQWDPDANIELHFNAAGQDATGTETLHAGTKNGKMLASACQESMVATLGLRDRGLKKRKASQRGGPSLWLPKAPSVILEPFFGTNAKDVKVIQAKGPAAIARAILTAANNYLAL